MPVTIYLVRHAQSIVNVSRDGYHRDPELTELGHQQSAELGAIFSELGRVDKVFASPMQRTIQTALGAFPEYKDKIILLPQLQERGSIPCAPCDIGSDPDVLLEKFGDTRLDFSHMTADWTDKGPGSFYAPQNAMERARAARQLIRESAKPFEGMNARIVVVTHGRFIQFLTESNIVFGNAQGVPYYFAPADEHDTEAKLIDASADNSGSSQ
ncbi:phosphoglycerate mutase-like protein [Xylaria digitata]|nr:phosphoglycerate mutase-like protein [Xylaria digitata]